MFCRASKIFRKRNNGKFADVINEMIKMKPDAKEILSTCRIAVNEEFISPEKKITSERTLILIPPSSGG